MTESPLSQNLKNLMIAKNNMTEAELAQETGIPQPTLNHILTAKTKRPRKDCLKALASYFSVTISQLLGTEHLQDSLASSRDITRLPVVGWNSILDKIDGKLNCDIVDQTVCDYPVSDPAFAIKMNDSSMQPLFPRGSVLIFDPQKQPQDRDYCLFFVKKAGTVLFRQLVLDGNKQMLKALNQDLEEFLRPVDKEDQYIALLVQSKFNHL